MATHWQIEVTENVNQRVVKRGWYDGDNVIDYVEKEYRTERPNAASGAQLYFAPERYTIKVYTHI